MPDQEKITINMSVVDLGQVDLLVEEGFYSSRTDFIRTAIRNQLNTHAQDVRTLVTRKSLVLGVLSYSRSDLEKKRERGERLEIFVVGMLHLDEDIPPQLAQEVIQSIKVSGIFKASEAVKAALADRTI